MIDAPIPEYNYAIDSTAGLTLIRVSSSNQITAVDGNAYRKLLNTDKSVVRQLCRHGVLHKSRLVKLDILIHRGWKNWKDSQPQCCR